MLLVHVKEVYRVCLCIGVKWHAVMDGQVAGLVNGNMLSRAGPKLYVRQ